MRSVVLFFGLLAACGGTDSDDSGGAAPTPEVQLIEIDAKLAPTGGVSVTAKAEATIPFSEYQGDWQMAFAHAAGSEAPNACDASNSRLANGIEFYQYRDESFAPGELYSWRVCMWSRAANSYTPGVTKSQTMPTE